jgi:hypothetical protein
MDWYLNQEWDEKSKEDFEKRLKRVRDKFSKAQYLRIKGSSLIKSDNEEKQKSGIDLLKRVIRDYSNEEFHSFFAYEQIGDYCVLKKKFEDAILNYKEVLGYYERDRNGTSGIVDIKYAEAIFEADCKDEFNASIDLLTAKFKQTNGSLDFKDEIFRYNLILSKLYKSIGSQDLYLIHGFKAIELYRSNKIQFPKYPKLGAINLSDSDLEHLKNLKN